MHQTQECFEVSDVAQEFTPRDGTYTAASPVEICIEIFSKI